MSVLDAMESEHALLDPLLAAVDQAFADDRLADRHLGDVIGERRIRGARRHALHRHLQGLQQRQRRQLAAGPGRPGDGDRQRPEAGDLHLHGRHRPVTSEIKE